MSDDNDLTIFREAREELDRLLEDPNFLGLLMRQTQESGDEVIYTGRDLFLHRQYITEAGETGRKHAADCLAFTRAGMGSFRYTPAFSR